MDTKVIVPNIQYEEPNLRLFQGTNGLAQGSPIIYCNFGSNDDRACGTGFVAGGGFNCAIGNQGDLM